MTIYTYAFLYAAIGVLSCLLMAAYEAYELRKNGLPIVFSTKKAAIILGICILLWPWVIPFSIMARILRI